MLGIDPGRTVAGPGAGQSRAFFAPHRAGFTAEMWRLVRPGGVLAVTTWGPELSEPAGGHFWESVRWAEPPLYRAFTPWDDITTPEAAGRPANPGRRGGRGRDGGITALQAG